MAKSKGLGARFELARDEYINRTIASVEGEVGTGKTYFGCTGPAPILIQNIDKGTEGVVEQFRKDGKEIYEVEYEWNPAETEEEGGGDVKEEAELKDAAIEIRDKWEKDYLYAINNGVRTCVMDNESRIWQVYRYAAFGGPNSGDMRDYDKLNLRFEALIAAAKKCEINLLMMRAMKDRWGMYGKPNAQGKKSFAKSGREVWGYEHLAGVVLTELTFVHRTKEEQDEAEDGMGEFVIKIGKCRQNTDLQFSLQPRMSLPELGTLIFPDTTEEDWS
jgi:hypothetical protein